jgi:hypothetical protein
VSIFPNVNACESPVSPHSFIHSQGNAAALTAATWGGYRITGSSRAYEYEKAKSLIPLKSPKLLFAILSADVDSGRDVPIATFRQ